ncbi:ras and Rab interactor 2-like isoform X2 [Amphiprion ocellaris]|uniref:ras and Rab interactor 2-like isoform X2 n=1 Tax=Amphiprion ocellaris TaxID=80972 RepID=UPI001649CB07|nr:ras and Rab interactor 2-like isoform X2 [Amphiprion ocellaris]
MEDRGTETAQQEEPLYDFPEPSQDSQRKLLGHQRGRGSLRSISVLDRLLLTVPVWLQLSINPATALHILRREPPGNFLVRKSRTSQRNVLCVRLADDSVPSFVQQFGIIEEQSSLSLETSAISFPDLPRLISFYCVSRDVLPFPLELPDAIAKAASHKELESISHMGIEFWSSHLNVRGPREAPKPQKDEDKKPDAVPSAPPATAAPQTSSAAQPDSAPQPDNQLRKAPETDTGTKPSGPNTALFHEFCPITTRSPSELDCGSGMGALCFINPLFLQSQNALCRRRMFKRSLKVRISTETSTPLSPPLAPPPPPPLMPKKKGRCKVQKGGQGTAQPTPIDLTAEDTQPQLPTQKAPIEVQPPSASPHLQPEMQEQSRTQIEANQSKTGVRGKFPTAQLTLTENLPDDSDYMKPSPVINPSQSPFLSPYLSPSVSPMAPPLFPKMSPSISPRDSPGASPSLSPYQSPSLSPKAPFSLSPYDSPSNSPSRSPYDFPSPSPQVPFSLSPFISQSFSQLTEQASYTQASPEREAEKDEAGVDEQRDEGGETKEALLNDREEEERNLVLQMNAASLNDTETPQDSLNEQADGTSL